MPSINARSYESTPPQKVAFLGLGVMGYPMAGHLATAGHTVSVYNRTDAKSEAFKAEFTGTTHGLTPKVAVANAEIVFCCVGNDDDLRSVVLGPDGAFAGMKSGAIFVDHTTASADVARELFLEANKLGLHFVDAPVSGGQPGAEKGVLTIMVGADEDTFARLQPVVVYRPTIMHTRFAFPGWTIYWVEG